MNNPDLRKEVKSLINMLKAHFEDLDNREQLSQDEMDSLLNETGLLYKKMVVLNYLGTIKEDLSGFPVLVSVEEREIVITEQANEAVITKPKLVLESQLVSIESKQEEHLPVAEANVIADLKEEAIVIPVAEKENVKELEVKQEKQISPTKVPLVDIKAGIGINDKFQFIAELFAGSGDKYEEAIKQLNFMESMESSLRYLETLRSHYSWKEDADTVQRFTALVRRRFL